MDRVTVVRSMTHPYPIHGVAYATDRHADHRRPDGAEPARRPALAVHRLRRRLPRPAAAGRRPAPVPDNIALPLPFSSQRVGEVPRAGPYAAFLGSAYNPVWTEFRGTGDRHASSRRCRTRSSTTPSRTSGITRRQPLRAGLGRRPAGRHHARPPRPAPLAAGAVRPRPPRPGRSDAGRSLDRYRDMAYSPDRLRRSCARPSTWAASR